MEPMDADSNPVPVPAVREKSTGFRPSTTGRIVVIENVYHADPHGQASQVAHRWNRLLGTDEQVYQRHCKVDEEAKPLDFGWLESCSLLTIENKEGQNLSVIPSQEERAAIRDRILEVYFGAGPACLIVRPGESARLDVEHPEALRIRCRKGRCRYLLTVFPT